VLGFTNVCIDLRATFYKYEIKLYPEKGRFLNLKFVNNFFLKINASFQTFKNVSVTFIRRFTVGYAENSYTL